MVGERCKPVYAQGALDYSVPVFDSPNSINNQVKPGHAAAHGNRRWIPDGDGPRNF